MKNIIIILVFLFVQKSLIGQIVVGYFPFQSQISINSNTDKILFADYKLETNNFLSNLNMEISPKINLKKSEKINYYTGLGISINPINSFSNLPITNGYFVDFGIRYKKFERIKNLQIIFELSPYLNREFDGGNLRSRIGIAWAFVK